MGSKHVSTARPIVWTGKSCKNSLPFTVRIVNNYRQHPNPLFPFQFLIFIPFLRQKLKEVQDLGRRTESIERDRHHMRDSSMQIDYQT
jgi:hypothetical protein